MNDKKMIAVCGLNCEACSAHQAMKNDDNDLREETAKKWNEQFAAFGANFAAKDINCVGCRNEGVHSGYCCDCSVRKCASEKGEENCFSCADFSSCNTIKEFEKSGINIEKNFKSLNKK